jgi:hypothetical protein
MEHNGRDRILKKCEAIVDTNTFARSTMFDECRGRILNEIKIISNSSKENGSATSLLSVVRLKTSLATLRELTCENHADTICAIDLIVGQLEHEIIKLATDIKVNEEESRRRLDIQIKMYLREIDILEYENEMLRQENDNFRY